MSESLRDLVVSLSLQTDNFTRNIKSVNKQIAEAESNFKLAAAGVDGFDKSADGLSAAVTTLERKLKLQKDIVDQYEKALDAANAKLQECTARQADYANRLENAKSQQATFATSVEGLTKVYEAYKYALGETDSQTQEAKADLDALTERYNAAAAEVQKLQGQDVALAKASQSAADAVSDTTTKLNNAKAAVASTQSALAAANTELESSKNEWLQAGKSMEAFAEKCSTVSDHLTTVGQTLTSTITKPIKSLAKETVEASIEYESAFTSVRKTVEGTEDEFETLDIGIKQMSTEVAASASDIAEVMAIAGQLGIGDENKQDLLDFTRVMIDLGNSTDIVAEEAASVTAKFANITGMGQDEVTNFGSTLVALGNNFATTESDIMTMAQRLAAAGTQVGLSESQILGFAAALSSVGVSAEMGGSAFSKALMKMEVAAATGGQDLEDFAAVSGMTADEFKTLWDSDPAAAFQAFIEGLAQMDDEGESAIAVLQEIGITEVRLRDTLLRSVNATDLFTEAQEMAAEAWEENTALSVEATKRYGTTESKITNLKNQAMLLAQQFGDDLNPTIQKLIEAASDLITKFSEMDESQRMQIIKIAAIVAAVGPLLTIIGKVGTGVSTLASLFSKVTTGLSALSSSVSAAGGGLSGLVSVVAGSPAAWIALGAAVVTATVALVDYASGAKAAREAMNSMNETAKEMLNTQATTLFDTGTSDPLAKFGLSESDFINATAATEDWFDLLIAAWTDGERDTDEQVQSFIDTFTTDSDEVRDKIANRESVLSGYGTLDEETKAQMEADLAQLDAWDQEIADLLQKRQNGYLSDEDQARLNEVLELRAEMKLSYSTGETGGYDTIIEGMQAEIDRILASGGTVDDSVYGDAINAIIQGRQAYLDSLTEGYNLQHAEIMQIEDEAERQAALNALNAQYNEQRKVGEEEYQAALKKVSMQTWTETNMDEQVDYLNELMELLTNPDGIDYAATDEWLKGMDEGKMTSMLALLAQLQESDPSGSALAELGVDADTLYNTINKIAEISSGDGYLEGINTVFSGALPDEITRVLVGLDCTQAEEDWAAFKEGKDTLPVTCSADVTLNPLDNAAITAWESANKNVTLVGPAAKVNVGLGNNWQSTIRTQYEQGKVKVYDNNGMALEVTPEVLEQITANDVVMLDEDGTMHIIITPEVGSKEGLEQSTEQYEDKTGKGTVIGEVLFNSTSDNVNRIIEQANVIKEYREQLDALNEKIDETHDKTLVDAETGLGVEQLEELIGSSQSVLSEYIDFLSEDDLMKMGGLAANLIAAITSGDYSDEEVEEFKAQLQSIFGVIEEAEKLYDDEGNFVSEGVAKGMADYNDWNGTASEMITKMLDAFNAVFGIASPAKAMNPTGGYIAAGVGEGMSSYDFTTDAASMALSVVSSVSNVLTKTTLAGIGRIAASGLANALSGYNMSSVGTSIAETISSAANDGMSTAGTNMASYLVTAAKASITTSTLRQVGVNAMAGLKNGINAGRAGVINAMKAAAKAALAAAKEELDIHSPSRVFRDEVGVMAMKGFGEGILQESKEQAKVIQNASRFLTGEAQAGSIVTNSNDNRRTYNNNVSSTVQVEQLVVRNEQDVRSLATEIATLTRRQQRGKGMRMA